MRHGPDTRRQAATLFGQGCSCADVARRLGIARSTSSVWHRRWRRGVLLEHRRSGRRLRLTRAQLNDLGRALLDPPTAHGLGEPIWSLRAIALLIERRTGVRYHHRHVSRLVRRMGWLTPPVERYAHAARLIQPIETVGGPLNLLVGLNDRQREAGNG